MDKIAKLRELFELKARIYIKTKAACLSRVGIGSKATEALIYLRDCGEGRTMGEMKENLSVCNSRITRIMDLLIKKKLAKRKLSAIDRRSWIGLITKKGIEFLEYYDFALNQVFADMEEAEIDPRNE